MHTYYVSYSHVDEDGSRIGFGGQVIPLPNPLRPDHLPALVKLIQQQTGARNVVPMFWQPFEDAAVKAQG